MEHDNVSGRSEDPKMPFDDDNADIMVDCRSSSSSSTFSSSSRFEVDIGENDTRAADVDDIVNGSPTQSPPIQVMSYDSGRILSSKSVKRCRNDSEWSLASSDSLFSIHMGNESFSGGLTPDAIKSSSLPTVIDTSTENERISASTNSRSSFAFEVNVGGGSPKEEVENNQLSSSAEPETIPKAPSITPKAGGNQWLHCFSCFPMCH